MEEPCFCSISNIMSCLVDKTKISLPVVVTACALGYIWAAKKQITNIKRQCDILEDDLKNIKRENFHIGEEIRYLKCTSSDTELLPILQKSCRSDKLCESPRTCSFHDKIRIEDSCFGANCRVGPTKMRKNRKLSPVCNSMDVVSYSTPEVYFDAKCDFPSRNQSSHQLSSLEWLPNAESTRMRHSPADKDQIDDIPCGSLKKPDRVSFDNNTCLNNNKRNCVLARDRRSTSPCKRRADSPKPTFNHTDCYSCNTEPKPRTPKCDTQCGNVEVVTPTRCVIKRPTSKRNKPCDILKYDDTKTKCKTHRATNKNTCQSNTSRCSRIKEKIDKYRNEIRKDLNILADSDCMVCSEDKLANKPDIIDLSNDNNSYKIFEYKCSSKKRDKCKYR